MKHILSRTAGLLILALATARAEPLLAGDNLDQWKIAGPAVCWSVKDGILTGASDPAKKGGILWTQKRFRNFVLKGEFRFEGRVDSGFFVRHENDQIQIGVSGSLKRDMTGSPYIGSLRAYPVEAKNAKELLKEGGWNTFILSVEGNRYIFHLNGKQVLDYVSQTAVEEGPIGLQVHPNLEMKIEFRNLDVEG